MASMTIRGLDDQLKSRLRIRAAVHGRSMEDEARVILRAALAEDNVQTPLWVESMRAKVAALGGVDLPLAPREPIKDPEVLL